MPITLESLKFYQSERMTDNSDGGGRQTGHEILSGVSNQVFDDVSDVDRAAGDVSLRKLFAAVSSLDTDKYLDASVAVFREPTDPAVSVVAFSTGSFYDERLALKDKLEQTISRGARWNGWLWGQHLTGQRVVVLWQRPENELPAIGARLSLVARSGGADAYSQFIWVTKATDTLRNVYDSNGVFQVREVSCEIAEPLIYDFTGNEPLRVDPAASTAATIIYASRYNPESVPLYGVRPTVKAGAIGDYSIQVDSLYSPIIPTAMNETALPDVNPGGDFPAFILGNQSDIRFILTDQIVKPEVSYYLGIGAIPGTITIAVSGSTITDDNGTMRLSGVDVGTVDYGNGVIRWNSSVPNYGTASKTITFKPCGRPLRVADTAAQQVTTGNRGFVWVMTLSPIPAPLTLRVAYRVNNKWYVIQDVGSGSLRGVDSSYGSGTLNFSTGTVTLTTGALPDVDSEIIYTWGTPVSYTRRGGDPVDAPVVRGTTAHAGIAPGTVSVSWTIGATTYTLTDTATKGVLAGTGGTGAIRYATGEWWVRPSTLPPVNTAFSIAYDYGDPVTETFAHPARDVDGYLDLALDNTGLQPNTVEVEWNVLIDKPETLSTTPAEMIVYPKVDPLKTCRDNGAGALPINGGSAGVVSYANGTVKFLPDFSTDVPWPRYTVEQVGTNAEGKPVYRNTFDHFEYIASPATFPIDESGSVTVRYRVVGGDTSATETVTLSQLELDITKGYGETISNGSTLFRIGSSVFVETGGRLYRDPSPLTGAGTVCGTLDRTSGRALIQSWPAGIANAVTLDSLVTELAGQPIEEVVFRTPVSPLRTGSLQMRYQLLDGTVKTKTVDDTGKLEDTDCTIKVDYSLGVVRARFGLWKKDADLTNEEKLQVWYDPDARVLFGSDLKIWKPALVKADSVIYNAVAQTFLPPDSNLLGINAARLPPDGKGLLFNVGRLVLAHHTDSMAFEGLSPTQSIDCGRVRLYRAVIEDSTGKRLSPDQYTLDREAGTITLSPSLDLTGFTAPYYVKHTVADMARVVAVDINGTLTLNKPLSHAYPANESRVSGLLYVGTLQARITNLFAQTTWDNVWQDSLRGDEPLAQYNDTQWPIVVSNAGAYPDRILVKFTSTIAFQVIGENLGVIGTGTTTQDFAPINPLTNAAYFSIPYQGWGTGWATGNCLRFNVMGASYPIDLIRAVQPSSPSGLDSDSVELLLLGNVDA